jgi:chromosome segregation ATPase
MPNGEKNGLPEGRATPRKGIHDTASIVRGDFLEAYHPNVRQMYFALLDLRTNEDLQKFRAEFPDFKNARDEVVMNSPEFQIRERELRKKVKEECDAFQDIYATREQNKALEKKAKDIGQKAAELDDREQALKEAEAKQREQARKALEHKVETEDQRKTLDQGLRDLEKQRAEVERMQAQLPELTRAATYDQRKKAYEAALEAVQQALQLAATYNDMARQAIFAFRTLRHNNRKTINNLRKSLDAILYTLKPEDAPKQKNP